MNFNLIYKSDSVIGNPEELKKYMKYGLNNSINDEDYNDSISIIECLQILETYNNIDLLEITYNPMGSYSIKCIY